MRKIMFSLKILRGKIEKKIQLVKKLLEELIFETKRRKDGLTFLVSDMLQFEPLMQSFCLKHL